MAKRLLRQTQLLDRRTADRDLELVPLRCERGDGGCVRARWLKGLWRCWRRRRYRGISSLLRLGRSFDGWRRGVLRARELADRGWDIGPRAQSRHDLFDFSTCLAAS